MRSCIPAQVVHFIPVLTSSLPRHPSPPAQRLWSPPLENDQFSVRRELVVAACCCCCVTGQRLISAQSERAAAEHFCPAPMIYCLLFFFFLRLSFTMLPHLPRTDEGRHPEVGVAACRVTKTYRAAFLPSRSPPGLTSRPAALSCQVPERHQRDPTEKGAVIRSAKAAAAAVAWRRQGRQQLATSGRTPPRPPPPPTRCRSESCLLFVHRTAEALRNGWRREGAERDGGAAATQRLIPSYGRTLLRRFHSHY